MSLHRELQSIREQMKSDFQDVMAGLATQRDALREATETITQALTKMNVALDHQEAILLTFAGQTEKRFSAMVDVVESHEDAIGDLRARVEALEKRAG